MSQAIFENEVYEEMKGEFFNKKYYSLLDKKGKKQLNRYFDIVENQSDRGAVRIALFDEMFLQSMDLKPFSKIQNIQIEHLPKKSLSIIEAKAVQQVDESERLSKFFLESHNLEQIVLMKIQSNFRLKNYGKVQDYKQLLKRIRKAELMLEYGVIN